MTRVAVVAVHGVADQEPKSSAREVAKLLSSRDGYSKFREVEIDFPLERVAPANVDADPSLTYMNQQFAQYRGGGTCKSIRLEAKHKDDDVHVYELYWADLSRAATSWRRLLAEFYQLILHLPSLGRNGIKAARMANNDHPLWLIAHVTQATAVWLLTVPAPLLNIALLSIGAITLAAEIPTGTPQVVAAAAPPLLLAGAALMYALRKAATHWLIWALAPVAYLGLIIAVVRSASTWPLYRVLAVWGVIAAVAATIGIAWLYRPMKRTALRCGIIAAAATAAVALTFIVRGGNTESAMYAAALETAQRMYLPLAVTWLAFFYVALIAAVAGLVALAFTPSGKRLNAYRATWTARFSLGFPAALFAIFTLSLWMLVIKAIKTVAPNDAITMWPPALLGREVPAGPIGYGALMDKLLFDGLGAFVCFIVALGVFSFFALWAATPSVLAEVRHPANTDERSHSLGAWLSRGLRLVAISGEIFTIQFVFLLLYLQEVLDVPLRSDKLQPLLVASAAAVAALLMGKSFATFRAVVDVMLDVDNYMRESPRRGAPRARIAERFASLLRFVCDEGYDRIVFVAHSQGTVITADLLRYLGATFQLPEAISKDKTKVRIFTMGSPLKQLYAKAFPYLYEWLENALQSLKVETWSNVYCSGDYVGRDIWGLETDPALFLRGKLPIKTPHGDHCAGAGAHTHYWTGETDDVGDHLNAQVVS